MVPSVISHSIFNNTSDREISIMEVMVVDYLSIFRKPFHDVDHAILIQKLNYSGVRAVANNYRN